MANLTDAQFNALAEGKFDFPKPLGTRLTGLLRVERESFWSRTAVGSWTEEVLTLAKGLK